MARKNIPKPLKNKVWDTYIGAKNGQGKCYCCQSILDSKNFECGHVVAVKMGGKDVLTNLRPICSCCNKSMGTRNLEEFKNIYFPPPKKEAKQYIKQIEKLIKMIDSKLNYKN